MGFLIPSNTGAIISGAVGVATSWAMTAFEDLRLNNVSANGMYAYVYTTNAKGERVPPFGDGMFVKKFTDDADPITIERCSITHSEASFNGPLVSSVVVPVYEISMSVIPFSDDAENLDTLSRFSSFQTDLDVNIGICYIRPNPGAMKPFGTFAEKTIQRYILFEGGKMDTSAPIPSVSGYRLSGRTYTFMFSGIPNEAEKPPSCKTMSGTWSL